MNFELNFFNCEIKKIRAFILVFLVGVSHISFAQSGSGDKINGENGSAGYILDMNRDTVSGFIIKEGDYVNEYGCSFSKEGIDFKKYKLGEILGFGNLETSEHYRLENIENKQVFLKVLVDGKITLLYSILNSGTFYVKKSNQISQLIEETFRNSVDGREYRLKKFINVIGYYMADEPSVSADIEKTQLTKPSLANIVMKYNSIEGVIPVDFYHDEVSKKQVQRGQIHVYAYGSLNSLSEYNSTKFKSFISPGFGLEFETPGLGKETYFLIDLNFGSTEVESTLLSTSVNLTGTQAKFTNTSLNFGTAIVSEKNVKVKGAVGLAFMSNSIDTDVNMQDLGFYEKFVGYKISVNTLIGNRFSILGSINNYSRQEFGGVNPEKTKVTIAQIGIAFKVI